MPESRVRKICIASLVVIGSNGLLERSFENSAAVSHVGHGLRRECKVSLFVSLARYAVAGYLGGGCQRQTGGVAISR